MAHVAAQGIRRICATIAAWQSGHRRKSSNDSSDCRGRRRPGFPANRGERSAQQPRGAPFRSVRIHSNSRALHYALSPSALRHEDFVASLVEMFSDQRVPVLQTHGVVLADAEAFLLMRADHVAHQVSQQAPIVQPPLPRLHGFVVRAAIQAQRKQALQRLFGEQKNPARLQHARHFAKHALRYP